MTKLLSRKPVFKSKLFTVYEDEIQIPSGLKKTHHNVLRDPAVSIFPLEGECVYLIDQYRYLHEKRLIEAVAGMIDPGEEPIVAAKRELREEAGITARDWISLFVEKTAGSIAIWNQYLFVAKDLSFGDQELEDSEDIKLIKMPLQDAVSKVFNNEIETGSTVSGLLMIDKLRREGKL